MNYPRFIFLMPRNDHILYVGGFSQPDETELDFDDTEPLAQRMAQRAREFFPDVATDHLDTSYPIAKGLRPARVGDVRVERELRTPKNAPNNEKYSRIVHSYGHAGSGWSFSFGCALDVMSLVDEALAQEPPVTMKGTLPSTIAHAQAYNEFQSLSISESK
jgi:D-amino-acid oxidase